MNKKLKFKYWLDQHKDLVYGYSLKMTGSEMEADDITQETFIRLWNHLDNISVFAIKGWLVKTARNLCIDFFRSRGRNKVYQLNDELGEIPELTEYHDPLHYAQENDVKTIINEKLDNLPETQKSIFILYEYEGMKYREISKSLDIPVNSVKVYLMRARKRLQKELEGYELQETV